MMSDALIGVTDTPPMAGYRCKETILKSGPLGHTGQKPNTSRSLGCSATHISGTTGAVSTASLFDNVLRFFYIDTAAQFIRFNDGLGLETRLSLGGEWGSLARGFGITWREGGGLKPSYHTVENPIRSQVSQTFVAKY